MEEGRYAAIWDLDGVLVDTGQFHYQAWLEVARELGLPFSEEDFRRTFGMRNPEIIGVLFGKAIPAEQVLEVSGRKEALFRRLARGHLRSLPGAVSLFRGLARAGFKQALATSTPRTNVDLILAELGLADQFDAVVTAEDVRAGKPEPEVFLVAARLLRVPPHRCVVLEDAVAGLEAARAAGMACVGVMGERRREEFLPAILECCYMVRSLEGLTPRELADLIDRAPRLTSGGADGNLRLATGY